MLKRSYKPEEIVAKLRRVDVLHSQGSTIADAIRQIGVSEVTFYRWRKEHGGMKTDQLKHLKELEKKDERLRQAVSDLTFDKLILKVLYEQPKRSRQWFIDGSCIRPRPAASGSRLVV